MLSVAHTMKQCGLMTSVDKIKSLENCACETQLRLPVHDWETTLNNHGQVDALLLDFRKAFDEVLHPNVQKNIKFYDTTGKTLPWLSAFLCNCSLFIMLDCAHSCAVSVTYGVPQGTVLGPTLFLLSINHLVDSYKSQIRLFSDNSIVCCDIATTMGQKALQSDLNSPSNWASTWQMDFNALTRVTRPSPTTAMPARTSTTSILSHYSLSRFTTWVSAVYRPLMG